MIILVEALIQSQEMKSIKNMSRTCTDQPGALFMDL